MRYRKKGRKVESGWIFFYFLFISNIYSVSAGVFTVTTTNNLGNGSLMWAVEQTQTRAGADTILFALQPDDPQYDGRIWRIFIPSALPTLTDDATFIDGFSQSPDSLLHAIDVRGDSALITAEGWRINSSFNVIRGLAFGGFPKTFLVISGSASHDNVIAGCHIGCSADGRTRLRNGLAGIELVRGSHHNLIGSENTALRNVLSGNGTCGIRVENSHSNLIIGNYIGTDATGLAALPNGEVFKQQGSAGIMLASQARNNRIGNATPMGRNVISGNNNTGLRIEWSGAEGNIVQGNYFGVGCDGHTCIPNGQAGLAIGRGARFNLIGGDSAACANIISGNFSSGVQFARASSQNRFKGNYVGTNASLTGVVPNAHNGLYFYGTQEEGYPQDNLIGPGNVICGNGVEPPFDWAGISVDNNGTGGNQFFGNYIGQDPTGRLQAGQPYGIMVQHGSHNNVFGPGNVIAHSRYDGVLIQHDSTRGNRFTQNLYLFNQGKAINRRDGQQGPAAPELTLMQKGVIAGQATGGTMVEIYGDSSGQKLTYLTTVTPGADGRFTWAGTLPEGWFLNALGMDAEGNTSEFSAGISTGVEATTLTAELLNGLYVRLTWKDDGKGKPRGYWIQRKGAGFYEERGFVAPTETLNSMACCSFQDTLSAPGDYCYRLKKLGADGLISFSQETLVRAQQPAAFVLHPLYPNPFNATTRLRFDLAKAATVSVHILNLTGKCVRRIPLGRLHSGSHHVDWDGRNDRGVSVASGVYFVQVRMNEITAGQKVLLLR
ncbi:MAG TPA: FlgD immunoglobulin-like domain containing protein [bacterium]|nr:FlgD immunoglobulin-like domain containing protein [bacterium]